MIPKWIKWNPFLRHFTFHVMLFSMTAINELLLRLARAMCAPDEIKSIFVVQTGICLHWDRAMGHMQRWTSKNIDCVCAFICWPVMSQQSLSLSMCAVHLHLSSCIDWCCFCCVQTNSSLPTSSIVVIFKLKMCTIWLLSFIGTKLNWHRLSEWVLFDGFIPSRRMDLIWVSLILNVKRI